MISLMRLNPAQEVMLPSIMSLKAMKNLTLLSLISLSTEKKWMPSPLSFIKTELMKEKRANEAILAIKKRYGKNAILKGINFEDGATGRERNAQIGGHRA